MNVRPSPERRVYAQLPEQRGRVDSVALGPGAIYFSQVAAQASKTRITRLMSMPRHEAGSNISSSSGTSREGAEVSGISCPTTGWWTPSTVQQTD